MVARRIVQENRVANCNRHPVKPGRELDYRTELLHASFSVRLAARVLGKLVRTCDTFRSKIAE